MWRPTPEVGKTESQLDFFCMLDYNNKKEALWQTHTNATYTCCKVTPLLWFVLVEIQFQKWKAKGYKQTSPRSHEHNEAEGELVATFRSLI